MIIRIADDYETIHARHKRIFPCRVLSPFNAKVNSPSKQVFVKKYEHVLFFPFLFD